MFYLPEFEDIAVRFCSPYDDHFYQRWCREAYDALLRHEHCTQDPERGTWSVAPATLRCVSFAEVDWSALAAHVTGLAARTGGKRVLVFDGSDIPHPRLGGLRRRSQTMLWIRWTSREGRRRRRRRGEPQQPPRPRRDHAGGAAWARSRRATVLGGVGP